MMQVRLGEIGGNNPYCIIKIKEKVLQNKKSIYRSFKLFSKVLIDAT